MLQFLFNSQQIYFQFFIDTDKRVNAHTSVGMLLKIKDNILANDGEYKSNRRERIDIEVRKVFCPEKQTVRDIIKKTLKLKKVIKPALNLTNKQKRSKDKKLKFNKKPIADRKGQHSLKAQIADAKIKTAEEEKNKLQSIMLDNDISKAIANKINKTKKIDDDLKRVGLSITLKNQIIKNLELGRVRAAEIINKRAKIKNIRGKKTRKALDIQKKKKLLFLDESLISIKDKEKIKKFNKRGNEKTQPLKNKCLRRKLPS
jgi:hypothetical protein